MFRTALFFIKLWSDQISKLACLPENIWFVWSKTSYSGDRGDVTMQDGRTNKQTTEDRATQPMEAGGWVSQKMTQSTGAVYNTYLSKILLFDNFLAFFCCVSIRLLTLLVIVGLQLIRVGQQWNKTSPNKPYKLPWISHAINTWNKLIFSPVLVLCLALRWNLHWGWLHFQCLLHQSARVLHSQPGWYKMHIWKLDTS